MNWSREEILLIDFVQQNPTLYLKKERRRSNLDKIWKELSVKIGWKIPECRRKWGRIRNSYFKRKAYNYVHSKFLDGRLSFLDLHPLEKPPGNSQQQSAQVKPPEINCVDEDTIKELLKTKTVEEKDDKFDKAIRKSVENLLGPQLLNSLSKQMGKCSSSNKNRHFYISKVVLSDSSEDEPDLPTKTNEHDSRERVSDRILFEDSSSSCLNSEQILIPLACESTKTASSTITKPSTENRNDSLEMAIMADLVKLNKEPNDMGAFFKNLAEYTLSKVSDEGQKELRLQICAMMTKEELDFLDETIIEE